MNAFTIPGRARSTMSIFDDLNADPGVMPSAWRFIDSLPATQKLELALKIVTECDLGDVDPYQFGLAKTGLAQLVEDSREADRREAVRIADGRPSLNPWAAGAGTGIWL